jgi:hypothetical protein
LPNLLAIAADTSLVSTITGTWVRHLEGYRLFNAEPAVTRWQRFGCGNIETTAADGTRVQLRVDNTKSLPGIDRTDDIKKGLAQVMSFGRLKKGCERRAVKTVLFGNLYAETHHEHYVKPLASVELRWPNQDPVWLFDGIIAMSRSIVNDPELAAIFPDIVSEPYADDSLDAGALLDLAAEEDE